MSRKIEVSRNAFITVVLALNDARLAGNSMLPMLLAPPGPNNPIDVLRNDLSNHLNGDNQCPQSDGGSNE